MFVRNSCHRNIYLNPFVISTISGSNSSLDAICRLNASQLQLSIPAPDISFIENITLRNWSNPSPIASIHTIRSFLKPLSKEHRMT